MKKSILVSLLGILFLSSLIPSSEYPNAASKGNPPHRPIIIINPGLPPLPNMPPICPNPTRLAPEASGPVIAPTL